MDCHILDNMLVHMHKNGQKNQDKNLKETFHDEMKCFHKIIQ